MVHTDGLLGCREGLAQHLTAEDGPPPEILALPAEDVLLDRLEREELDELLKGVVHVFRFHRENGQRT